MAIVINQLLIIAGRCIAKNIEMICKSGKETKLNIYIKMHTLPD